MPDWLVIDAETKWTLVQFGFLGLAFFMGRFWLRSRGAILLVCALGMTGLMFANLMIDGTGACAAYLFVPILFSACVYRRRDLTPSRTDGGQPS